VRTPQEWQPIGVTLLPMRSAKFFVAFGTFLLLFWLSPLLSAQQPLLVVVNQGDRNVSLVDPAAGKEIATISENLTEVHGHEVAVSPDGRTAYVPIYGSSGVGKPGIDGHEMYVIDLPTRKITGKVDFGKGVRPHCVIYEPHSKMLFVTTELSNSITIVDPANLKIVGEIPTGAPQSHMLAITSDGRTGYTANVVPGSVSVLDIPGRKLISVIPISGNTQRIAISADNKLVFTSDQTKAQLAVIDAGTNKIKAWIPLPGLGYGAASTPDSRFLLVSSADKSVAVVDIATLKVVRAIPVPGAPQEIVISPDGKFAYVSCMLGDKSGQIAVIDLGKWSVSSITAGVGADGLAWAGGKSAKSGD
jgi:DNA-binding beta-propeller fold protein YncE